MAVMICLAVVWMMGNALARQQAPVAGMSIGVSADELVTVAKGWGAKNQIMGQDVYNDKREKVGVADDLIVSPDKAVSYAIIGRPDRCNLTEFRGWRRSSSCFKYIGLRIRGIRAPMLVYRLDFQGKVRLGRVLYLN